MKDYFVNGNIYTVREAARGLWLVNVNEEMDEDGDLAWYCFDTELEALRFIASDAAKEDE